MSYILSEYGIKFITTEESFASIVHNNDGHDTGGFGHTGTWPDGSPLEVGQTVSRDQAVSWFKEDVRSILDRLWQIDKYYTQYQVDALTSILFNCGIHIADENHDLGCAMTHGHCDKTISDAILEYDMATINGVRGPFLATRRKAEHDMFLGESEVSTPSGLFKCAIKQGNNK